jgi:hypothetical protein
MTLTDPARDARIRKLHERGWSQRQIAADVGLTQARRKPCAETADGYSPTSHRDGWPSSERQPGSRIRPEHHGALHCVRPVGMARAAQPCLVSLPGVPPSIGRQIAGATTAPEAKRVHANTIHDKNHRIDELGKQLGELLRRSRHRAAGWRR